MPVKKSELVLMIGYLANYIPFFFIDRPMYVYHYFNALIFLFLLLPFALPRIRHSMINTVHDRWFAPVFIVILLGIALINFVMLIPETYGTHSWSYLLAHLP